MYTPVEEVPWHYQAGCRFPRRREGWIVYALAWRAT